MVMLCCVALRCVVGILFWFGVAVPRLNNKDINVSDDIDYYYDDDCGIYGATTLSRDFRSSVAEKRFNFLWWQ